ncbi:hypothetical protein VFMJ11_B0019 (plasmid) [Aliivibrio fischeri MJ11]|uniref:Uncharacterized protein n=1 Tax=Aliivibrio fischeri (strain MJ11) TaxID=388396 RepID=B5EVW2_ALIFM|nr:hypothetical protein [Aliivibrio fischeri]ACH64650.1 hypothetical protein VFMJ11_B0019 [Aliivibrio fischeri MJ11]
MSIILEKLGITATDIERVEKQEQQNELAIANIQKKWGDWLKQYEQKAKNQRITTMIKRNLLASSSTKISPTQKALKKAVTWSSSKHNENKKADVIKSILTDIAAMDPNTITTGQLFTTGCFSKGAHLCGKSSCATLFSNEANYQLYCIYGSPYLLIEGIGIVMFEGFNYPSPPYLFPFDEEVELKYQEYEAEIHNISSSIF